MMEKIEDFIMNYAIFTMALMSVVFLLGVVLPLIKAWKSFVKMKHPETSERNKIVHEYDFNTMCLIAYLMGIGLIMTAPPMFLMIIHR